MGDAVLYALASTLFTYLLTALGAAGVFVMDTHGNLAKTELVMAVAVGLMLAAVMELVADTAREVETGTSLRKGLQWVPSVVGTAVACLCLWSFDACFTRCHRDPLPADSGGGTSHGTAGPSAAGAASGRGDGGGTGLDPSFTQYRTMSAAETASAPQTPQRVAIEMVGVGVAASTGSDSDDEAGDLSYGGPADAVPGVGGGGGGAGDASAVVSSPIEGPPPLSDLASGLLHDSSRRELDTRSITPSGLYVHSAHGVVHAGDDTDNHDAFGPSEEEVKKARLLVFALAVQHIPEALACGVAFAGAADPDNDTTMGVALSLTLAIGLQDIPEGMTAAFVLRNLGMSRTKAFFWGQLTGVVQPIGGLIGAAAVLLVQAILPYALAFAASSMIFVIVKDMVPDIMTEDSRRMRVALVVMASYAAMTVLSTLIDAIEL